MAMGSMLALAVAVMIGAVPQSAGPLAVTPVPINTSSGDQFDPHVDGELAAYSEITATQQIRYYVFGTGVDTAISNALPDGSVASDLLSDVQGGRIVFTRITADRSAIMLFDSAATTLTEVNAQAGSNRIGVSIGGPSLAYVDFALQSAGEIVHVDLANSNATTRLTSDVAADQNVSVSADGKVIVWERCEGSLLLCDVAQATVTAGTWTVSPVTSTPTFAEESPDTNGALVVYTSNRGAGSDGYDLFYRPVAGGAESQLQLPGDQVHPSIAAGLIAFESRVNGGASDLYLYEIATNRLFQLTATPTLNESLNDVTVLANGDVRVVWDRDDELIARNVYGATFTLPTANTCANRTVILGASRSYNPARWVDGSASPSPQLKFVLPAAIPVIGGNAGNGTSTLTLRAGTTTATCVYKSGSRAPHPHTPAELARASQYVFDRCVGASLFAGDLVAVDEVTLQVARGDNHGGTTRVRLVLAEVCTGTPVFPSTGSGGTCRHHDDNDGHGHDDGDDDDGDDDGDDDDGDDDDGDDDGHDDDHECDDGGGHDRFGCSSSGAMGPMVLGLAALLLASRRRRVVALRLPRSR